MGKIDHIKDIIENHTPISITPQDIQNMQRSYDFLEEFQKGRVIYGINTGFGPMAQFRIDDSE